MKANSLLLAALILSAGCSKQPPKPAPGTAPSGPYGEGYQPAEYQGEGCTRYQQGKGYGSHPKASLPASLWSDADAPATIDSGDSNPLELGVRFQSEISGSITGLRFYKAAANTGAHVGHLWSSSGTLLGGVNFTCETKSGWQSATFSSPLRITAGTYYVASYFAPNGHYSLTRPYFTTSHDVPPLHAIADGPGGPNGAYNHPGSGFPTASYQASNYWADVIFVPDDQPVIPPALALATVEPPSGPASGGTNVTLGGGGFVTGTTVKFGDQASTAVTVSSSTSLIAVSPANTAGSKNMTVTNPDGQSVTMPAGYIYLDNAIAPSGQGLLSGMTPAHYTVPAGWTLVQTVDFENNSAGEGATMAGMYIDCSGKGHASKCAAKGNYQPSDTIFWRSANLQGSQDMYLSFWEYAEPNGRLNVDYDIGGLVAPGQTDAMVRFQVGCGGHDGGNLAGDIPYWWNALTERPILYVEGVYGTPWPNYATWGWGANCMSPNLTANGAQGYGNWTQWEIRVKSNTPTASSQPADGEVQMYQAGILTNQIRPYSGPCSGNPAPCSNLNGTLNMAGVAHYAQAAGVYTVIFGFLDQAKTKCAPVPAPANVTTHDLFFRSFDQPAPCANQAPSNGYVPVFNRYLDDVIVLKR
jgi:hypothetical protein